MASIRRQPLRRVYIQKEDGKTEATLDSGSRGQDRAEGDGRNTECYYEQDFLDCSYGFDPEEGTHQALDEVRRVICTRPTGWILDLDVTAYFDSIVRKQLMGMI